MLSSGPIRTVVASYPSPREPRRAHFIEGIHRAIPGSEVLAPQVFREDPLDELRSGVPVRRFSYPSGGRPPRAGGWSPWTVLRYLQSGLRRAREVWPDRDAARGGVVVGHWIVPSGWIAARIAERLGVPLVLWGHGSDIHRYGRLPGVRGVVGDLCRRATRTVVASDDLGRRVAEWSGRSRDDFTVIPVGVDEEFTASPERRGGPPPWRLLFVGDLLESKGLPLVVDAWRRLRSRGCPVELEVVGDGPERALLETPADDGTRVDWRGVGTPTEINASMQRAHFLVLPSAAEGTPLVVQEAIVTQLPVLATAVGGIPRLFTDRAGWVAIDRDATALASTIEEQIDLGSARYHDTVAAMGHSDADSLRLSRTVERFCAVLREVSS